MAKKKVITKKETKPKTKKKGNYEIGYGKPPAKYNIKKGEVKNPKGINVSPERRALRQLTEAELAEAITKVFTSTEKDCLELINDPNTTLGHKVILRAAVDAAEHGNYGKFNEILERVIGKVPNKTDITSKGEKLTLNPDAKVQVKQLVKDLENEY